MREYKQGAKTLLMNKIATKTGARPRKSNSSVRYFTEDDCRRILNYIEDLEIQVAEKKGG